MNAYYRNGLYFPATKTQERECVYHCMTLSQQEMESEVILNPIDQIQHSPALQVTRTHNNVICAKAVQKLQKGEIILVESPFSSLLDRRKDRSTPLFLITWVIRLCTQLKLHPTKYELIKVWLQELTPRNISLDEAGILEKIKLNRFVHDSNSHLYCSASSFNHSCSSNAAAHIADDGLCSIFAVRDIQPQEEITICYNKDLLCCDSVVRRRDILQKHYFFHCVCDCCRHSSETQVWGKLLQLGVTQITLECTCFNCGKIDVLCLQKCGQCRVARYCSKKCQREHWHQNHKTECDNWKRNIIFGEIVRL